MPSRANTSSGQCCVTWAAIWQHGKKSLGWSVTMVAPPSCWNGRIPANEVISLSWWVSNRLLYLFAIADTRGRSTDEMTRPEENLHFWKLAAEEADCFEQPYPFANDHARFLFYRQREPNLHYVPHEDYRCTVTVMSGLPGSGKDTWLAANRSGLPVVSLDDIRDELDIEAVENQGEVIQLARERCRELLRAGQSFAFSATNLLRSDPAAVARPVCRLWCSHRDRVY